MFKRILVISALPLALLAACQSGTKPDQPAAGPANPAQTTEAADAAVPNGTYGCYRALLPGAADSITLHLVMGPVVAGEGANVFASYHDAAGQPHELMAETRTDPDSLILRGFDPNSGDAWRLRRQGREWRGRVGKQPLAFRATRPATALSVSFFTDSVAAFPGKADTPYAHARLLAALPAGPAALQANVLRGLRGDTLAGQAVGTLPQLWGQHWADYKKFYQEDVAGLQPADTADALPSYALRYDQHTAICVYWNQPDLLSLGFFQYSYTGGAHGNYGTTGASFDPRTGQRLGFTEVFRPGSEAQLSAVLDRAVRRTFELTPSQPLSSELMVDKMPVTQNFYLTSSGIVFIYVPYEIASYVQGEIRVFVPFTELKPLLLPRAPLNS